MAVVSSADARKKVPYLRTGERVDGVLYQTLATGERMMVTTMLYDEGAHVPAHSHAEEQAGFLVSGSIEITINGEKNVLAPGDSWSIPSNCAHSINALEKSTTVEVFSPPREDYLDR